MNAIRPIPLHPEHPEYEPTFTLDRQIASAREAMGEARWAALNAEWDDPVGRDFGVVELMK